MKVKKRIAINGFGRIGRMCFRNLLEDDKVEVVAINDLTDVPTLVHLLKYDSVHGHFPDQVSFSGDTIKTGNFSCIVSNKKEPSELPWKSLDVDIVIESTGRFTSAEEARAHLIAGAKRVLITAPADGVKTIVPGVNDHEISPDDLILSNASCTTNCLAPLVKVIHEKFGIEKGYITTVHAYTADQRLHDAPHKDLRRARAAALSIIPTTTGAARAVGEVFPALKGKLDGVALRVPVPDGSITDLVAILSSEVTKEGINDAILHASLNEMKGIIEYCSDPIVSIDIIGNPHSCIFDSALTSVNENLLKVMAWYDNEAGYSRRVCDLLYKM